MNIDEGLYLENYKMNCPKDYNAFVKGLDIINNLITTLEESYICLDTITNLILCRSLNDVNIYTTCSFTKLKDFYPNLIIEKNDAVLMIDNYRYVFYNFEDVSTSITSSDKFFNKKLSATLDKLYFTMDTLVMSPKKFITDIYRGIDDIRSEQIKTLVSPAQAVKDNPLVMLEALAKMSQFNFDICRPLQKVMFKESNLLTKMHIKEIAIVMRKILSGKYYMNAFSFADKNDIFYGMNQLETFTKRILIEELPYIDRLALLYLFIGNIPDAVDIDQDLLNQITEKMNLVNLLATSTVKPMMVYNIGEQMLLECDTICTLYKKHYHSQAKKIKMIKKNLIIENIRELNFSYLELRNTLGYEKKTVRTKVIMNILLQRVINGDVPNNAFLLKREAADINNEINSLFNYIEPSQTLEYSEDMIKNLKAKFDKDFKFLCDCFIYDEKDLYSMSYFDRMDILNRAHKLAREVLLSTSQYKILVEKELI